MANETEPDRFQEMLDQFYETSGADINYPYHPMQYLKDQKAIAERPPDPKPIYTTWVDPSNGHTHVVRCSPRHYYLRTYQCLIDRYGLKVGLGRGMRACALFSFFKRCHVRLEQEGLSWLSTDLDVQRCLEFLAYLLNYPVASEHQLHPDAIPERAIDKFLVGTTTRSL